MPQSGDDDIDDVAVAAIKEVREELQKLADDAAAEGTLEE